MVDSVRVVEAPMKQESTPLNPATTALLMELQRNRTAMEGIRQTLERREQESPGSVHFFPASYQSSVRLRVTHIVIACGTAAESIGVKVGTNIVFRLHTTVGGVITLPAEITLDRGVEISLVDLATGGAPATTLDAFIFFYPDEKEFTK